ncbi:MAG TPA: hypothetical protein VJ725_26200 [Thermoanaerobaculia bacterium]|nr:hypothetical protein [Thermoanaerobaculia bacterium]
MKKRSFLGSLLLCFAAFGDPCQASEWISVSPGVMQRTLDDKIETLGFGAEGLRFRLEGLEVHLAFLRQEYSLYPSRALRQAIRAQRAEVLRTEAALRKADGDGRLESSREAIRNEAGACPVDYDATADAFPLSQGVSANASSSFNNDCGYSGEVYAHAYARATAANNTVTTRTLSDPAPNTPRMGGNVTASASASADGVKDCYSYAYSSVINYDLEIIYEVSDTNTQCSGAAAVRPFASDAPSNVTMPASPPLDPNSSAIVTNLNGESWHDAILYAHGVSVFDASAGTPRTIVCTGTPGPCDLSQQPVPINAAWKPSSGSTAKMSVVDYTKRKIYDFHGVVTNADGTVKINADGTVTAKYGGVTDLDGSGSPGVNGANLSHLFGLVRVFEMERAAADPANAIQHALAFVSNYVCTSYRYPAGRSNGYASGAGCIPMGGRIFLDSTADCSTVSPVGEKAICYALQKYGAYAIGTTDSAFSLEFENPTNGQPGGSAPDPYPGVGLSGDYYGIEHLPWSKLKVAADCRCSPSDLAAASGRPFSPKAPSNGTLPAYPSLDPDGAAMLANLNGGSYHGANLYSYGIPVFDASVGTSRSIVCTESWGTCPLAGKQVQINPSWKPSGGSNREMTVIDYAGRKVYDFYQVAVDADGTVKINADGTVSTGWGAVSDLDGSGRSPGHHADLSFLFGLVRVFEMERAASDPANAIPHALAFGSQFVCGDAYRFPAGWENGSFAGAGCVPAGTRVFLDSSADCSTVSPVGEKAICYALQKYGAYAVSHSGSAFTLQFEVPTAGQPGGSGADPYPGAGFTGDYDDLSSIPWAKLKVAKDCQCTPY